MIQRTIVCALILGGLLAAALATGCSDDGAKQPCPTRCGVAMVCDDSLKRCVPAAGCQGGCAEGATCVNGACQCNPGLKDCNGDLFSSGGNGCECATVCSSGVCSDLPPRDAYIRPDSYNRPDILATMDAPKKEGGPGIDGGGKVCTYNDKNACGKDSSKWCYQAACIPCSKGFFNCNNTKGCECDKAGCNGTQCAGKCSGGECP